MISNFFSRFIRLVKAAAAPLVGIFYLNHVGDLAALLVLVSLIGGNTVHLASGDQLPGAVSKGLFVVFLTSVNFMQNINFPFLSTLLFPLKGRTFPLQFTYQLLIMTIINSNFVLFFIKRQITKNPQKASNCVFKKMCLFF